MTLTKQKILCIDKEQFEGFGDNRFFTLQTSILLKTVEEQLWVRTNTQGHIQPSFQLDSGCWEYLDERDFCSFRETILLKREKKKQAKNVQAIYRSDSIPSKHKFLSPDALPLPRPVRTHRTQVSYRLCVLSAYPPSVSSITRAHKMVLNTYA